jgi:Cu/Ag efflux pump CusA
MPKPGPIYNLFAGGYEGLLKVGLRFPLLTVFLSLLTLIPLYFLATNLESGFMPEMDEGAFVLDYNMPVGTSLNQTDKVLRRVEAVLLKTPDIHGYIRRTGAELGFFATESYTGDILVSLKSSGERRPMSEIIDGLREELKAEVPELETEFVPLVLDQIGDLAGVEQPIEVKVFGPEPATLRELAGQVGKVLEDVKGIVDVNTHVLLGNPDRAIRPGGEHCARARPDDQDPGALSGPDPV